ncbi:DUF6449 domain-containing protein [Blautia sp.]|jgi:ABC-2 type transport system permease protein|uniref:DUF6449 domain-containing protein n=1 Tax=Blautia sp. TaxID=1955243 RepID=UPI002A7601CF|nr:DUF6449 domain-containing protein [Blautia sp.]MDY3017686.1 DUF6449 domain-containing protein [Blautia sp.]
MKSKICSSKYVKTVSKGKGWIPAFLTLGFLLAFPVVSLLMIGNWRGSGYTSEQMEFLYENLWKDGFLLTGGFVAVAAAVLNGINGFIYLYSKRQTDFYHSLPVKRSRMFWNRIYTGLVYYLVPYMIMVFLAICIGAARGFFSLKLMGEALALFGIHLIIYLLIYFSVVLILCITGNLLMGIFCMGMLYCYGPGLSLLLGGYRYGFYETYYIEKNYGLIRFLREYISPAGLINQFAEAYQKGEGMRLFMVLLVLTVLLTYLSYVAYLKRPSESAGSPMVYRGAAFIVKIMVVIPCGLGAGYFFYLIPISSMKTFWWIFGLILGTVLSHGFMETAYQMDFHCFFKKKIQLLAAGLIVAACAMVYETDLFHYDSYVPPKEKLASVSVDMNMFSNNMGTYIKEVEDGIYQVGMESADWDLREYSVSGKKEIGDKTYNAFCSIAEKQKERGKKYEKGDHIVEGTNSDIVLKTGVMYKLKSGKKIYRNYRINAIESQELIQCLYEEENLKDNVLDMLDLGTEYLDEMYFNAADGRGYMIFQEQKEKWAELLEALKKDIEDAGAESFTGIPCCSIQLTYSLPGVMSVSTLVPGEENRKEYAYSTINVLPEYTHTLSVLEETGYPITLDDIKIKKATVQYYGKEKEKTAVYEKAEELQKLKDAAVPAGGFYSWLECEEDVSVIFQTEQGYEFYVRLLKNKIPDFVQKDSEEEKVSVIGGADGPTSIIIKPREEDQTDE